MKTAEDFKSYTSFGAQIDLTSTAESPIATPRGCMRIRINTVGSGTLGVITAAGQTRTKVVIAGEELELQAVAITTATNVASLTVFWGGA